MWWFFHYFIAKKGIRQTLVQDIVILILIDTINLSKSVSNLGDERLAD